MPNLLEGEDVCGLFFANFHHERLHVQDKRERKNRILIKSLMYRCLFHLKKQN